MGPDARCLVTGGSGFAGGHLVSELRTAGADVRAPTHAEVDLLDPGRAEACIRDAQPTHVFHLAALASVRRSWEAPLETLCANQAMTLNVLEAVRRAAPEAAVLVASSGEVYGAPEELPVTEDAPVRPRNPYAVSKVACELVAKLYEDVHGLSVTCTRAFNHAGPGQSTEYVVGDLTHQVAQAEHEGRAAVTVRTGNPHVGRDFCDVRDVVRAYELAIEAEGGPYNVASGRAVAVAEIVATLTELARLEVRHEVEPSRVRPGEVERVQGSAARLEAATGWRPRIELRQTIRDALDGWRRESAPTDSA